MANKICGEVVSLSMFKKNRLSFVSCCVLFDDDYNEYKRLLEERKEKEADILVKQKSAIL